MKKIIFVSTGRCGTKRLYEILKTKKLNAVVKHQMRFSRIANVVGHFMYSVKESDYVKERLYNIITSDFLYKQCFICTDPLTSMIIPKKVINDPDTMIVHITRPEDEVACSLFKISRNRLKSFIAHNFIPFWQIGILPLENLINNKVINKYRNMCKMKNLYFYEKYSSNPNYIKISMEEVFYTETLTKLLKAFLDKDVTFSSLEMSKKSNM